MWDRQARLRSGLAPHLPERRVEADARIHVTQRHLRDLERHARGFALLPSQPAASVLNGRHASRLRGRGLDFEELRGYLPGDDPRTIDWNVTARTGMPHVRVFNEERDRPVLLVVDQRMSMFFGTRHNMKSVSAAEAAAIAAFRVLDQGDRIGGIVFGDEVIAEIPPQRSRKSLNRLLAAIERANALLRADAAVTANPLPLNRPLGSVAKIARRDHLVLVLSDFDGIDAQTEKLVARIARHNDLILCPVTDPVSREIPDNMKLVVSDGSLQLTLDTSSGQTLEQLGDFARGRLAQLLRWQAKYGLPILPLDAGESTVPQILRLTGLHRRPAGART